MGVGGSTGLGIIPKKQFFLLLPIFKTVLTTWLQASPPLTHCLRASSTSLVRFVTAINTEAARPSLLSDTISSLEPLDIVSFS